MLAGALTWGKELHKGMFVSIHELNEEDTIQSSTQSHIIKVYFSLSHHNLTYAIFHGPQFIGDCKTAT